VNDPLGRIEALEQRLKAVEQATEPIELKIVRGLPLPEATLLQKIMDQVGSMTPDVSQLKVDVSGLKTDVATLKADMEVVKGALQEILKRLPEKGEGKA
jgi:hypothetical protein